MPSRCKACGHFATASGLVKGSARWDVVLIYISLANPEENTSYKELKLIRWCLLT